MSPWIPVASSATAVSATGPPLPRVVAWFARPPEDVVGDLGVDPTRGLDPADVPARRRRHGANVLREAKRESAWRILVRQFESLLVLLLVAAAGISFAFGQWHEGVAVAVVIAINAAIGFATELRAVRSMEALRRLGTATTRVRRGGRLHELPAAELVVGDVVAIEAGDLVSADLRLLTASKLQVNEAALTGESAPVGKRVAAVAADTPLPERTSMLFKGTPVTRGSAEAVVVGVGMDTELGRIAALADEAAAEERTPLERQLDRLGGRLVWVTLGVAALVTASGVASGRSLWLMVQTGIALAVATVPEGLPIVATVALARGMLRMARRKALVRRLSAVETLGATTVVCSDKTGTLTENRMTVTTLALPDGTVAVAPGATAGARFTLDGAACDPSTHAGLRTALEIGALCNNAELPETGDPMEVALLAVASAAGIERRALLAERPEVREEAFDAETRMMATWHREGDAVLVAVKGAPERVLAACTAVRGASGERPLPADECAQWLAHNEALAADGLRVLALATRRADSERVAPYEDLVFIGLVGFLDPPRHDVRQAIADCRGAGMRVVMVTGDQPATARKVGVELGLIDDEQAEVVAGSELSGELSEPDRRRLARAVIFARVSPKQKLDLIRLHQQAGEIVAMTGDGVNDAPALRKADIGVAMGLRGTQVAREAADIVLRDDAFATIVAAVRHGRVIFGNIRTFVFYLLSCNVSEVMVVGIASLANVPLPLRPLQILFLNLVTDVFPALALGMGEGDPRVMQAPPRDPREPILTRGHWLAIAGYGAVITVAVLGALLLALHWLGLPEGQAVTVSFLTLALAQLWHVFSMRARGSSLLRNEVTRNVWVWGALVLCTVILAAAVQVPALARVLDIHALDRSAWLLVAVMSLLPWMVGQVATSLPPRR